MGLLENPTNHREKQEAARRKRRRSAPRARRCLLKGCERRFRPRQAYQRYCGGQCRKAARAWSRWKAQQRYRDTKPGKEKRNGQSQRYRERVRNRKLSADEAVPDAARVITSDFFSMPVAAGLAATKSSRASGDLRCNSFARTSAGVQWNACLNASGAGSGRAPAKNRLQLIQTY